MVKNTDLTPFKTTYEIGEIAKHRYFGGRLVVIGFHPTNDQMVECRTEDLRAQYFYRHELCKLNGDVSVPEDPIDNGKYQPVQGIE